jgi:hypothetical protein
MKKRTFVYVVIACFGLFPFLLAGNVDVSGNWELTMQSPRGEFTMTYTGTVSDNTMSGEVQMMNRTIEWTATKKQS